MVYLRKHLRKGNAYYSVVETFRENTKVRQRILHYIGSELEYNQFLQGAIGAKDFLSSDLENLLYQTPVSLWNLTEQFNINKIISSHFPKDWGVDAGIASSIMILNYATERRSKRKLHDWYDQTYLKYLLKTPSVKINKDLLCRTLDFFTEEKIEKIHTEIFNIQKEKLKLTDETLFYDLTAVTFEGETVEMAKKGHNAEHSYNPQINIGLAVTEQKIPIVHRVFEGNKKDVQTVEKIIEMLEKTGTLTKTIFIYDRGMASDYNFSLLEEKKCKYIAGTPKTKTIKDNILKLKNDDFTEIKEHEISYTEIKDDKNRRILIFWNKKLQEDQKLIREKRIEKIKEKLETLKKNKDHYANERLWEKIGMITKDMRKYFDIKINEELEFNLKEEKLRELEKLEGRYAIITNTNLSAKEVLEHYRDRNLVEMSFRDLKMFVDIGPVRHRKENRVLAHVFLAVLAFGLRSIIELKLRRANINISAQEAIEKLSNVRALVAGDKILRLTGETEQTRSIVSTLS